MCSLTLQSATTGTDLWLHNHCHPNSITYIHNWKWIMNVCLTLTLSKKNNTRAGLNSRGSKSPWKTTTVKHWGSGHAWISIQLLFPWDFEFPQKTEQVLILLRMSIKEGPAMHTTVPIRATFIHHFLRHIFLPFKWVGTFWNWWYCKICHTDTRNKLRPSQEPQWFLPLSCSSDPACSASCLFCPTC